jgi:HEAT repeat protein
MQVLCALLLFLSPETERLLLGPSPFFRYEGMERARRAGDVALLAHAAQSPQWDTRRLAAIALGPRCPETLVDDPVAVVRAAAIESLDLAIPRDVLLKHVKDTDDAVRAAAVWALRASNVQSRLRPLLKDPAPSVRLAAMGAMNRRSELLRLAKGTGKDFGMAVGALGVLGRSGDASAAGTMLRMLDRAVQEKQRIFDDPKVSADLALARAVGEMARRGVQVGGRPVRDQLRRLVAKADMKGRAGLILAEAVAEARDAESARRIIDGQIVARKKSRMPYSSINFVFRGGMHAFARRPWPELAPLLLPLLASRDVVVRRAVAEALHGDAARLALRDPDAQVRAIGCRRLGKQKPLLGALRDPEPMVRIAAVAALGRVGGADAGAAVLGLRQDPDAGVRRAVIGSVLRLAVEDRAGVLYAFAMEDADASVRAAAAASLEFLEDKTVYPRAIAALRHDKRRVRERAIELLHALSTARFGYKPEQPLAGAAAWKAWWRSKREKKVGGFQYHVEDLRRRGIDLVLVIDATGSMAPLIQATKRRLESVMVGLRRVVPDLRVRVVFYRDRGRGDAFLTLASPLTHDERLLEDFIACVPAGGGGDTAEAVLNGLSAAILKTRWRKKSQRIVLLFGDAPPHDSDLALIESTCLEFKGVVHAVDVTGYGRASRGRGHLASFAKIAKWGSGSFVRSGNDRELLREILVLTLGPKHRKAVEALFGL